MSIRLSLLLEGAYALHEGRKRRVEWETNAERNCVQKVSPASETFSEAQPRANARACSDDETCDDQDMAFLHGALRSRGLELRAPDAENAFLWLVSLEARTHQALRVKAPEGTAFEWMLGSDGDEIQCSDGCAHKDEPLEKLAKALRRLSTIVAVKAAATSQYGEGHVAPQDHEDAAWRKELVRDAMLDFEQKELADLLLQKTSEDDLEIQMVCPRAQSPQSPVEDAVMSSQPTPALLPSKFSKRSPSELPL